MIETRILVVEDEESLARFIELELLHEGYSVEKAYDGRSALELAISEDFDVILLDIMLPELNGFEVLRRLQKEKQTPVILLTARDSVMDKVAGLDAGAIDYITKPFAIEELLARIRVVRKKKTANMNSQMSANMTEQMSANMTEQMSSNTSEQMTEAGGLRKPQNDGGAISAKEEGVISYKELSLDERKHRVTYSGQEITLTNREFLMLKTMMENKDIVLSRDYLLEHVCGYDYAGETNIVDVYVRHLRAKIDETFDVKFIHTIRGAGYVFK